MFSATTGCSSIGETLGQFSERFGEALSRLLEPASGTPTVLAEAMRYSALAPGKRIRPYLVTRCCEIVGGTFDDALGAAAAIECVHAFSLIHDDLPAMDNDDVRRGRPTNHKVFGEAVAILAGDALLTVAFELIVRPTRRPERAVRIVGELARGAGWDGMIGGQVADIQGQEAVPDPGRVPYIHERKTASLMAAACRMGAIAGGGSDLEVEQLGAYGRHLGLAFQIADDLLDVTSTAQQVGKGVGKDARAGKQTYPACFGTEESRRAGWRAVESALACLAPFGERAADLRELAVFCTERAR